MKLEGAEAISQLQELANLVKYRVAPMDCTLVPVQ